MPNIKQLIALVVGFLLTVLTHYLNIGLPEEDVRNGIISIFVIVWGVLSHDANDASLWKQKTTLTAMLGGVFWFITSVFHLGITEEAKGWIMTAIMSAVGYYTLNHSDVAHEVNDTVGTKSL